MSDSKTHWKKVQNRHYLGAWDFQPGEEKTVEIVKVVREIVPSEKSEECTVAYIKNDKPLIVNSVNAKTIEKVLGTPYIEDWAGKKIALYVQAGVKAFGDVVDAIRVRKSPPKLPEFSPTSPQWDAAKVALKEGTTTMEKILQVYSVSPANQKLLKP